MPDSIILSAYMLCGPCVLIKPYPFQDLPAQYWTSAIASRIVACTSLSTYNAQEQLATARQMLDDEVRAMKLAISLAQRRRNLLSLSARLPPEVLSRCFWFLSCIDSPKAQTSHSSASVLSSMKLGWMKVLHDCEEWRNVALADPRLWSEVSFVLGSQWATQMIFLAKSAPMSFDARISSYKDRAVLRQVLSSHLSNIRDLTIHDEAYLLRPIIQTIPTAPLLQSLELKHQGNHTDLSNVFGNDLPALRRLTLIGFSLSPACFPILSSLIDLSITFLRAVGTHAAPVQSLDAFLAILANSTSLERLSLVNCFPTYDDKSTPSTPLHNTTFPALKSITLEGPVADCCSLLQHIHFPPTANLLLTCTPDDADADQSAIKATLFPGIAACLHGDLRAPIRTLSFIPLGCTVHSLKVAAWDISDSDFGTTKNATFPRGPKFCYGPDVPTSFSLILTYSSTTSFVSISSLLDLSGLRTLRMAKPKEFTDTKKWIETLVHLKELEHISVTGPSAIAFCCALTASMKSKDSGSTSSQSSKTKTTRSKKKKTSSSSAATNDTRRVLLPRLTFLKLREVSFEEATPGSKKLFHQALPSLLTKREMLGKPVKHLSIRECMVISIWILRLERVVNKVDWDYFNGFDSEMDEFDMEMEMMMMYEDGMYGGEMYGDGMSGDEMFEVFHGHYGE